MNVWKGAWYLAKHEILQDRWKILISLSFVIYMLLFSIPLFMADFAGERETTMNWATDFIYLSLLPCLGFVINKSMMGYWKEDTFTKKMAHWHTMPITSKQIVLGRLIHLTIVLLASQLIFFALQYTYFYVNEANLSILDFMLYGLSWFLYSLSMAIAYIYWEIGYPGKTYFLVNFIYIFGFLALSVCLSIFKVGNIVVNSFHLIEDGNWWIVLVALAVCIAAIFIGINRMENRLEKRSYSV
ncbi:hypothetical protein [Paenibacillus sp. sgz302251]|uniref:hypothetical protein n=1 Tax=Paenibacillus sp. sgz302251 TaxID=3414493 RepID=UPI003C7B54C4